MLPQIKRPARSDDGDVEIEVVDVRNVDGSELSDDDPTMLATNTLYPKGQGKGSNSTRPPASAKANLSLGNLTNKGSSKRAAQSFGDEPTRLMPAKHGAKSSVIPAPPISVPPPVSRSHSSRPPARLSDRPGALPEPRVPVRGSGAPPAHASSPPAPLPNSSLANPGTAAEFRPPAVPSSRRPAPPPAFRDREESHTMLRPLGALSENAVHEPKVSIAVPSAGAIKAQVDAARAKRMADQRARAAETLEVTPVSISERFVVQGRPAAPWAVAFVAMGIFAGLATAMFTGGRSSAIAAFIDPGRLAVAAAAAQPAAPPVAPVVQPASDPAANMATTTTPATPAAADPALDLAPTTPTNVFAVGHAAVKTTDAPAATPVAHVAPKPTPVAKADPPPARVDSKPDPAPVAKADPKPAPAGDKSSDSSSSHGSKSSKGKHGGGDVDSAAAADALAKAQLENSL